MLAGAASESGGFILGKLCPGTKRNFLNGYILYSKSPEKFFGR